MLEEQKIMAANYAFYAAYRFADIKAMERVWSALDDVAMYGPSDRSIVGHDAVMNHLRRRLEDLPTPDIRPRGPAVVKTRTSALVICIEDIDGRQQTATNIFRKENGRWRLTHHHTSGPSVFRVANSTRSPFLH